MHVKCASGSEWLEELRWQYYVLAPEAAQYGHESELLRHLFLRSLHPMFLMTALGQIALQQDGGLGRESLTPLGEFESSMNNMQTSGSAVQATDCRFGCYDSVRLCALKGHDLLMLLCP